MTRHGCSTSSASCSHLTEGKHDDFVDAFTLAL